MALKTQESPERSETTELIFANTFLVQLLKKQQNPKSKPKSYFLFQPTANKKLTT